MFGWLRRRLDEFGRSGRWPAVRRHHLEREPACVACGRSKDLEVHHIKPYRDHPELELDAGNLITLCADPCHFVFGHLLDYARRANPHVREDAERYRSRLREASIDGPEAAS